MATINLKKVFSTCRRNFGNHNGRPDKSDGLDPQFAKLKKELTLAQRDLSNLRNQLHQAKENIAKERAERGSKSKKDDSPDLGPDEEVGSKRFRQQAKRAKALRPGTSPPSPPLKGFKILPTGDDSDSEEEDDYPEPNARATYAKAKFAHIQPTIQKKTSQMDVDPSPKKDKGRASCTPYSSAIDRHSDRFFAKG